MEQDDALAALAALAHETRLSVFRLLVTAGPAGLPAGELAQRLDVLSNTLSTHLGILARAGLVVAERHGRTIRYSASYDAMRGLIGFLMHDCCAGDPAVCGPVAEIARRAMTGAGADHPGPDPPR